MRQLDPEETLIAGAMGEIHTPEADIVTGVMEKLAHRPRRRAGRRIAAAVAACALVVALAAVNLDGLVALLGGQAPDGATGTGVVENVPYQVFGYAEDQGIRMEVVSAETDGERFVVELTFTDLEGDRLTERTVLNLDTYMGEDFAVTTYGTSTVGLDEGVLRVEMSGELSGYTDEALTLWASSLVLNIDEYTGTLPVSLADLPEPETAKLSFGEQITTMSDHRADYALEDQITSLMPGGMDIAIPEGGTLTLDNAGIVDGYLQVLYRQALSRNDDESGYMYVMAGDGTRLDTVVSWDYYPDGAGGYTDPFGDAEAVYTAYLYDLDGHDPAELTVGYEYYVYDTIRGDWTVRVDLDALDTVEADCEVELGPITVTSVKLSALGVTLTGEGDFTDDPEIIELHEQGIVIETADGARTLPYQGGRNDGVRIKISCGEDTPLDIDTVTAVVINGETIPIDG